MSSLKHTSRHKKRRFTHCGPGSHSKPVWLVPVSIYVFCMLWGVMGECGSMWGNVTIGTKFVSVFFDLVV